MDEYEEISDCLDRLVEAIRLFVKKIETKNEIVEQIQKEVHHLSSLAKMVGGKVAEDIGFLSQEALQFLDKSDDPRQESALIERCLVLKNDLWEL